MTEKELMKAVIDCGHLFNWHIAHFRTARNAKGIHMTPVGADGKGFPDLCLVRDRVIFAELKVGYNKLRPDQEVWRDKIIAAGAEYYLWREQDWLEGRVERVLR